MLVSCSSRLEGKHLTTVEGVPVRTLTRISRLYEPGVEVPLDLSLSNIQLIDADFAVPHTVRSLKLRNKNLTSIFNLTLPHRLKILTLAGNPLVDTRISRANFSILIQCTHVSATVATPGDDCPAPNERLMTPFNFELCVLPDPNNQEEMQAAPLSTFRASFVTSVLPILGAAVGGTILLAALFVLRFRRRHPAIQLQKSKTQSSQKGGAWSAPWPQT
ncbi:hypothetical protein DYB34_012989, partial [Aphanomyces astaci]